MEQADAKFGNSGNTEVDKNEGPISFRAAIAFTIEKEGQTSTIAFGLPDYPNVEPAKPSTEPPAVICFNCGKKGHIAKLCLKPRVKRCKNCDEEGHTVAKCPLPILCTICQSNEHTRYHCKEGKKTQEKPRKAMKNDRQTPTIQPDVVIYIQPEHVSHMALEFHIAYHDASNDEMNTNAELVRRNIDMKLWGDNLLNINTNAISASLQYRARHPYCVGKYERLMACLHETSPRCPASPRWHELLHTQHVRGVQRKTGSRAILPQYSQEQ